MPCPITSHPSSRRRVFFCPQLHIIHPADRWLSSRQCLTLLDMPSSSVKWTHCTLHTSVGISSVTHGLSSGVEAQSEVEGLLHSRSPLTEPWIALPAGSYGYSDCVGHSCQPLCECKGHSINESIEQSEQHSRCRRGDAARYSVAASHIRGGRGGGGVGSTSR